MFRSRLNAAYTISYSLRTARIAFLNFLRILPCSLTCGSFRFMPLLHAITSQYSGTLNSLPDLPTDYARTLPRGLTPVMNGFRLLAG